MDRRHARQRNGQRDPGRLLHRLLLGWFAGLSDMPT
jgi:hypothetical protein